MGSESHQNLIFKGISQVTETTGRAGVQGFGAKVVQGSSAIAKLGFQNTKPGPDRSPKLWGALGFDDLASNSRKAALQL